MPKNNTEIIEAIIGREGDKYTDVPGDRGGPTKFGITLGTLSEWRRSLVTSEDVKALTIEEARAILCQKFLVEPGINKIANDDIRSAVLDFAVNADPKQAIKELQRVVGTTPDGVLGPVTLAALPRLDGKKVAARLLAQRARFYGRLVTDHPSQAKFAAGWINRTMDMLEEYL